MRCPGHSCTGWGGVGSRGDRAASPQAMAFSCAAPPKPQVTLSGLEVTKGREKSRFGGLPFLETARTASATSLPPLRVTMERGLWVRAVPVASWKGLRVLPGPQDHSPPQARRGPSRPTGQSCSLMLGGWRRRMDQLCCFLTFTRCHSHIIKCTRFKSQFRDF